MFIVVENRTMRARLHLPCYAALLLIMSLACEKSPTTQTGGSSAENQRKVPTTQPVTDQGTTEFPRVPLGLPALVIPADNPMTPAKVELGKMLYFDKRISKDGTISCATCHDPATAWAERRATSQGIANQIGERNSPAVVNAAYLDVQFWDGRAKSLEDQALGPMENPIEMGHSLTELVAQLNGIPGYKERFQEVFGTGVTKEGMAKAIAAFERTVLSGNSAYDRFEAGDKTALSEQQQRGLELFVGKGECSNCHKPPVFSNSKFYNAGVGSNKDPGREKVTGQQSDRGKFRVPALREAARTAPYFHDGATPTLQEAVKLMASGGIDNAQLSDMLKSVREAKLTDRDVADLASFVTALNGEVPVVQPPAMP